MNKRSLATAALAAFLVSPLLAVTANATPETTFADGTYAVGVDVAAGTYYTPGGDNFPCLLAYIPSITATYAEAITGRGNITGPTYMKLAGGQFVQAIGGCIWTLRT